jgi:hypothetical protein
LKKKLQKKKFSNHKLHEELENAELDKTNEDLKNQLDLSEEVPLQLEAELRKELEAEWI